MKLTQTQQLIIEDRKRNILVSAGAGTGKTRVLVERFLGLVSKNEALVGEILALTFTEKAASEMKTRLLERFHELHLDQARRDLELSYISTFHAFASRVLKEHPLEAGVDPEFQVLESEEAELLKEQALDQVIEQAFLDSRDEIFPLLKTFGEETLRNGILKIWRAACTEGKSLVDFFKYPSRVVWDEKDKIKILQKLQDLGGNELENEWKHFYNIAPWDWKVFEEYQSWLKPFALKRKDKENWQELLKLGRKFSGCQMDTQTEPWRKKVETLALAFGTAYETLKKQEGVLDFDDLQIKILDLFENPGAMNQKIKGHYQKQFRAIMVDEFQDTSPIQARLVECLSGGNYLFFVGDYKQSIYGFRGTSPEHFLNKENEYRQAKQGVRVALLENFRTQAPILDFINLFFESLWKEDALPFEGLLAKTPEAALNIESEELSHSVEVLVTEQKEDESLARARMREAEKVVDKILAYREQGIPFGDMALLFQAMSAVGIYEQALKHAGIPYFVISGRGFYHQPEIKDMMSLLAYLENPLSDIPLASVLRSPLFQLKDDTIFWLAQSVKSEDEKRPLYDSLSLFEKDEHIPEVEKEKLREFSQLSKEWLDLKDRFSISGFLERVLDETFYAVQVLASSQGVRRYANLKKLVDLAREHESEKHLSFGDFIRVVRRLENQEVRESEAQIESEKSGKVVRLMTIHAAKGLEFPVVFLMDLAHEKRSPEDKKFLAQSGLGYSFQLWNDQERDFEKPGYWQVLDEAARRREKEESKRLCYVAMTRAKQRLVLSGVYKEKKSEKATFYEMASWMDWIVTLRDVIHPFCYFNDSENGKRRGYLSPVEKKSFQAILSNFEPQPEEKLFSKIVTRELLIKQESQILKRIESPLPKPSRVIDLSVSAYVNFHKEQTEFQSVDADLERKESLNQEDFDSSAADFGTRFHKMMEWIDFKNPNQGLERLLKDIFQNAEDDLNRARKMLEGFFASDQFKAIQKAKRVYRELPFILNERHGIIHGVIDLLYQDVQGGWHVLDYKTGEGDERKAEDSGYLIQMKLYGFAAFQILKEVPKEAALYFFKNQWPYCLSLNEEMLGDFQQVVQEDQLSLLERLGQIS